MTSDARDPRQPALFDPPPAGRGHRLRSFLRSALTVAARLLIPMIGAAVGAVIALNLVPYDLHAAGVPVRVSMSTFSHTGIAGNTSLGNISYPDVDGLPIGFHVSPQDIDLANLRSLSQNSDAFADRAHADFTRELPAIKRHFLIAFFIGALLGALAGEIARRAVIGVIPAYRRREYARLEARGPGRNSLDLFGRTVAGAAALSILAASYGAATFNSEWRQTYQVSGLLADFKAIPGKLTELYNRDTTSAEKVQALLKLEDTLTAPAATEPKATEPAFKVLFISDLHLRDMYPYLTRFVHDQGIKLVINTGDEAEYGSSFEMTKKYRTSIESLTRTVPMIWIAGNHDSPETVKVMRDVRGVIVLGDKVHGTDGEYKVTGQEVRAYGLLIAGIGDPRVFAAEGKAGSADTAVTNPLEIAAVEQAGTSFNSDQTVDIGMTHEPVAVDSLQHTLDARLMVSGHYHEQNTPDELQKDNYINLIEGSTGMGGLDHYDTSPMEFSVMSVARDCQFTQITRYQLSDPARQADTSGAQIRTIGFKPQKVDSGRTCSVRKGISDQVDWDGTAGKVVSAGGG